MSQQQDVCVFHIQTLFMYTGQISSCVINECVRVHTARTLRRVQLLERLRQTGRHPTSTVVNHYVPPPSEVSGKVWLQRARKIRIDRGRCIWRALRRAAIWTNFLMTLLCCPFSLVQRVTTGTPTRVSSLGAIITPLTCKICSKAMQKN